MNFPPRAGRVSGRATPSLRHAPRAKLQRTNPGSSPLSLRGILFKRSGPALGLTRGQGDNQMIQNWLKGVVIAALTAAGAVAAQAADLPTRKEAPAPVFVPPLTWTGFYIGVNAGGVWGSGHLSSTLFASGFPVLERDWPGGNFGGSQTGFIGGGQAGYNWQTGSFVLGAETDFDWTSLSRHSSLLARRSSTPSGEATS